MTDTLIELKTVSEVVDALGGSHEVMAVAKVDKHQVVSNWVGRGRFSSRTYLRLTTALERRGMCASPELWGIDPIDEAGRAH